METREGTVVSEGLEDWDSDTEAPQPKVLVEILVCPAHNYYAVAINDTRVTPSKCCGSWTVLRQWKAVSVSEIEAILRGA